MENNTFFILGMGRSGTKFLSSLLNNNNEYPVIHECFMDLLSYQFAYRNKHHAFLYFNYFRKHYINKKINSYNNYYGEVNSVLRHHLPAIKHFYPNANIFHLVRDGRFVVRSMMSRKTMRKYDLITKLALPPVNSEMRSRWYFINRFEKICWYWATENEYLRKNSLNIIKFEQIITDYHYFKQNLLNHIDINISEQQWLNYKNKPQNITKKYKFPHPDNWSNEMKLIFNKICGKEMKKYDYSLFDLK